MSRANAPTDKRNVNQSRERSSKQFGKCKRVLTTNLTNHTNKDNETGSTNNSEKNLTNATKKCKMKNSIRAERPIQAVPCLDATFFTSLPLWTSVQNLSFRSAVFLAPRDLVSKFERVRATSTIPRNL